MSDPEDNCFQADMEITLELKEVIKNDIEEMYEELNVLYILQLFNSIFEAESSPKCGATTF